MTPEVESFATEVSDFSLRGLEGLTTEYIPPPLGKFNPEGSWRQSYASVPFPAVDTAVV